MKFGEDEVSKSGEGEIEALASTFFEIEALTSRHSSKSKPSLLDCEDVEENMEDTHDEFLVERDVDENVADNVISVEEQTLGEDGLMVSDMGMSTTQRRESMNAFFDRYVHAKISLKQFVKQYERALRNKVEKEFQVDFKSYSQMLRYDDLCQDFADVANLITDDEVQSHVIKEWIINKKQELLTIKSDSGSIIISHVGNPFTSQCNESKDNVSGCVRDPISTKRKGAPKKLRKKNPLESSSKKTKTSTKGKRPTSSHSNAPMVAPIVEASPQLLLGDAQIHAYPQHLPASSLVRPTSTNLIFTSFRFTCFNLSIPFNFSFGVCLCSYSTIGHSVSYYYHIFPNEVALANEPWLRTSNSTRSCGKGSMVYFEVFCFNLHPTKGTLPHRFSKIRKENVVAGSLFCF
ncbi:uncharacterized protein LOC111411381 [Olea europaea var. sylvestris]|uniref:uncharacterized protein LOC111411381 n=1 Tax=Olea europaea var. sylvestris TaxID=158386 RepID=UPI000C1D547F|nr:uncharacterized protein LOC111411381 [Olea europaea var. sylvestris]